MVVLPRKQFIYALAAVALFVAGIWLYKAFAPAPVQPAGYQPAIPAHGMSGAPTSTVTVQKPLIVIDKPTARKKMKLPTAIVDNPSVVITSTASAPASEGGHEIATVLDTTTGITETVIKENPRPWFGFGGKTEIGLRAGLSTRGEQAALYVRQDILRVGKVYLAGYGEVNGGTTNAEAKGMIDLSVRF